MVKEIEYIIDKNGCYICTSHYSEKNGYIRKRIGNKKYLLHRYMYEQKYGEIPSGKLACHTCDNRQCINPDHIFIGTHRDNTSDMLNKGRAKFGLHRHRNFKAISPEGIVYFSNSQKDFANEHGLTSSNISACLNSRKYRYTHKNWKFTFI